MPKLPKPGDRGRIEAALTPLIRDALEAMRELHDVFDWQQQAAFAQLFQQTAAVLEAGRIVQREGVSEKDAVDAAAERLGLSGDSVRARARRWPKDSRTLCTPTAPASGRIVGERCEEPNPEEDR